MNCQSCQEQLLSAEIYTAETLPSESKAHLRECVDCRRLLVRLMRLDRATQLLVEPDATAAKLVFLDSLRPVSPLRLAGAGEQPAARRRERSLLLQIWPQLAMAASILICVGLGVGLAIWKKNQKQSNLVAINPLPSNGVASRTAAGPATAPSNDSKSSVAAAGATLPVMDRLVGWNVDLSEAESPEELAEIYKDELAGLEQEVQQGKESGTLSAENGELASRLIENGKWLSEHTDPLDQAEGFENLADSLLDLTQIAASKNDASAAGQFVRHFGLVSTGIHAKLENARKKGIITPEQKARLERMAKSNAALEEKLKRLLDESPAAARKAIDQALDADQKARAKAKEKAKGKDGPKNHPSKSTHAAPAHKDKDKDKDGAKK